MVANSLQLNEWKGKMAKEVLGVKGVNFEAQNFKANGKIIILDKI